MPEAPYIDAVARWHYKFMVRHNGLSDTWLRRVGAAIRALAERVDKQRCVVIHMESEPELGQDTHERLLRESLQMLDIAFQEEVQRRAIDLEIEKVLPEGEANDKV